VKASSVPAPHIRIYLAAAAGTCYTDGMNRFLLDDIFKWLPNTAVVELQCVLKRAGSHLQQTIREKVSIH
jgi:hypothetical protein